MRISEKPSKHILMKASSTSHLDKVDFAIVELSYWFLETLYQRLAMVQLCASDSKFNSLNFWYAPVGFYFKSASDLCCEEVASSCNGWAYVTLDPEEERALVMPENQFDGAQLVITKQGYAYFKALSKYTIDECITEPFLINEVIINHALVSENSSQFFTPC